jgi:hypothetical protein
MKGVQLLVALLALASAQAVAQQRPVGGGPRNDFPSGERSSVIGRERVSDVFLIDQQVIQVVEPKEEAKPAEAAPPAAAPAPAPPAEPRKPYAIGEMYKSLPGSCMKLIQDGASYYLCSGEWYQQVGGGQYKAVEAP